MADLASFNQDDKEKEQENGAPAAVSSGQSAVVSASGNAPSSPQGPSSSGRFTNISNYLKANQGFNQTGGGLAGKVAGNIQDSNKKVGENINLAKNEFTSQAENNASTFRDPSGWKPGAQQVSIGDPAKSRSPSDVFANNPFVSDTTTASTAQQPAQPAQPVKPQPLISRAVANPTNLSDEDFQKFTQMRDAEYKGPTDLNNVAKLQADVENVKGMANQTGSESGRFNLLRQMFNKQGYSGGQQKLDNLLMQADPTQNAALRATKNIANSSASDLINSRNQAQLTGQQYIDEARATKNETRGALFGEVGKFDQSLQDKATKAQQDRQALIENIRGDLKNGVASDEAMKMLGLNEGSDIMNLNLNDYLTPSEFKATKQNVASGEDYSRMQALQKLAGNTAEGDTSKILDSFKDTQQAGGFDKTNPFDNVDFGSDSQFAKDLAARKSEFEKESADPYRQMSEAQGALEGDTYVKGGISKNLADKTNEYREQLNAIKSGNLIPELKNTNFDNMSFEQLNNVMKQYGIGDASFQNQNNNYYGNRGTMGDFLLGQNKFEQDKLNTNQGKYNQLKEQFGVGKKLGRK